MYSISMEELKYMVQGIYDERTLKIIKSEGINIFSFDFRPRSFNFIQEHIFLEIVKKNFSENDRLFLYFEKSNDYMISKLITDLKNYIPSMDNIYFIFDDIDLIDPNFEFNFYCTYHDKLEKNIFNHSKCVGLFVEFKYFEHAINNHSLEKYTQNLMYRFSNLFTRNLEINLVLQFSDNLLSSLFAYLDFTYVALPISNDVEVCYRNVDQMKIKKELSIKRKYINF